MDLCCKVMMSLLFNMLCRFGIAFFPRNMHLLISWLQSLSAVILEPPKIVLKSRDITLPTKSPKVKAMVSPIIMYGCESWTIKKAECRRIDAFKLWCWRRLLTVPWTARRSNQSILKAINTEYSMEGLKLKFQYFGHLMWRVNSLEKTDAGKGWRQKKRAAEDEMVR